MLCAQNGASRVLAFEPSPSNILAFREHLAANPPLVDRIEIVQAAVADRDGDVEFFVNERDGAVSQMRADGVDQYDHGDAASVQTVPVVRLDSVWPARAAAPSFLKIDVEGAEALVLAGAARLLDAHYPVVLMEVHNEAAGRASIAQLSRAGYRCWRIDAGGHLAPLAGDLEYGHVLARADR
jgi:FkbM family methyltransferase